MGHFLEILIVRALKARGWETAWTVLDDGGQREIEIQVPGPNGTEAVSGHPDGICRHPEWTSGLWVVLECKSMSVDRAIEVEQYGVAAVYPSYLVQAALYAWRLHEMGMVAHPGRAIFGIMDREGRFLSPERIKIPSEVVPGVFDKMQSVLDLRHLGMVPARPYSQSSTECGFCNYHKLCWGAPKSYGRKGRPPIVHWKPGDNPAVLDAAEQWRASKPQVDMARDILQEASRANDQATIEVGGILAGPFVPRESPAYDPKALEDRVPMDVLRQCLSRNQPVKRPPFWVRLAAGPRKENKEREASNSA